jgi:K+-transporting ATPase ATPase C chain
LGAVAAPLFPDQADGSLLRVRGAIVGSRLIGQSFTRPEWFHPRPSAAGSGYDGTASGGTNLAPGNSRLKDGATDMMGIRELAARYRRVNGLAPQTPIPIDAVTRSGSGLDPDVSPANAFLQVARVARARKLEESAVRRLVAEHVVQPQLGFLGEPRVSVLELNLALDQLRQKSAAPLP